MRFHQYLAVIAAVGSLSHAFMVPEGQGDGVFEGWVDENGVEQSVKISDLLPFEELRAKLKTTLDARSQLEKRDYYGCERVTLNKNDVGMAAYNLGQTCDAINGVNAHSNQYAVSGDAVVYNCNPNNVRVRCTSTAVNTYVSDIEDRCPVTRGGYYQIDEEGYYEQAYGYTQTGHAICRMYDNVPHKSR